MFSRKSEQNKLSIIIFRQYRYLTLQRHTYSNKACSGHTINYWDEYILFMMGIIWIRSIHYGSIFPWLNSFNMGLFRNSIPTRPGKDVQSPGGGGGGGHGGHWLFELKYQLRNYSPPLFGQRTAPVLLPPNLQPPLFMGAQGQTLEINHE